ncbi:type III restriction/modification system, res subunit [Campylobacter iguaniorum]|uniref:restriction endonuclease n=1 Tax=Campylobacter iguaniorum TaxID=1244531 RepID=UPI0007C8F43E|nr:DEAD/DEAH box helicase family protein [Campylobacter iguaniorum]ANE36057.1 type III restriction/modification system, res subunit [Campylobacter iguaniorum]
MIFEKQDFQQTCINNIISILSNFDFKNQTTANLKECLDKFYQGSYCAISSNSDKLNLDILMETGTGKTFTYLNLIFELNKVYKQNKFIIFAPRKAIVESIKQNIKLTKDYFYNEFKKHLKTYIYSDSKSGSAIINHYIKNEDELSVLILTNSAIDKKDNILNRKHENLFNDGTIFENIISLKPISIIDEPHLLKGDKFNEYFSKINSLYFRFGATFPKEDEHKLSNLAYVLDSVCAFKNYLVKQIKVSQITNSNDEICLLNADSKNKKAIFSYFIGGIDKKFTLHYGDDLGVINHKFRGITLQKVTKDKAHLSNAQTIELKSSYKLSDEEIINLLKTAINFHFEKEERLFARNIKALSLFFIPNIDDFRGENPFIKTKFEELYKAKRDEVLKQNISSEYRAYLMRDFDDKQNLCVHQGYFSGDAKPSKSEKSTDKESQEARDIRLILEEKEKLISFETPLRFIFSVWALQEGWDNPNIFTLTKLASSSSDISRHQQVGRGLRLCVNDSGKRVTHSFTDYDDNLFYDINSLDMIVNSFERSYLQGLQDEITSSSFSFNGNVLYEDILDKFELNSNQKSRFFIHLQDNNILDFDEENNRYNIISPLYEYMQNSEIIKNILKDKFIPILEVFKDSANKTSQIINKNVKSQNIKIRSNLANEFKELWQTINQKSKIIYKNIQTQNLIDDVVLEFNKTTIEKTLISLETKKYNAQKDKIVIENTKIIDEINYQNLDTINILKDFCKDENLPLSFCMAIYNKLNKQKIQNNPKIALHTLKTIIKERLHSSLISSLSYEFTQNCFSNLALNDILYDENGKPRDSISQYSLGRYITKDKDPSDAYLYDNAVWDSKIEEEVIFEDQKNLNDLELTVFAKLPKLSIPTPFKSYEPDFAYLLKGKDGKKIFFVCETKGYDDAKLIPSEEQKKIDYAKKFFQSLDEALKDKNIKVKFQTRINKQNLTQIIHEVLKNDR